MNNIILLLTGSFLLAAPFIAAALGGLYSERSGVVNIGLEGMMTIGAFSGTTVMVLFDNTPFTVTLGILCACLAGMAFATLHAYLCVTLKMDQIISGVVINMVTLALSIYLCKMFFASNVTPLFSADSIQVISKINLVTIYVFVLAIITHFVINYTKWGLRVRAVGENPQAADAMGINVSKIRYQSVILSGAFAGFAGIILCLNIVTKFTPTTVSGAGFISLAVLIFGRHRPLNLIFAGLTFGFFKQLGIISMTSDIEFIPSVIFDILPYIITIIVIIIVSRGKNSEMESLGVAYDKELR